MANGDGRRGNDLKNSMAPSIQDAIEREKVSKKCRSSPSTRWLARRGRTVDGDGAIGNGELVGDGENFSDSRRTEASRDA